MPRGPGSWSRSGSRRGSRTGKPTWYQLVADGAVVRTSKARQAEPRARLARHSRLRRPRPTAAARELSVVLGRPNPGAASERHLDGDV